MKKFKEFSIGDTFQSTCSISEKELDEYLSFSRVRNAFLDEMKKGESMVSGRSSADITLSLLEPMAIQNGRTGTPDS